MNKRIVGIYDKIIDDISEKDYKIKMKKLLDKSFLETEELFQKLIRNNRLVYQYLYEENAFMITYFSYLLCKNKMQNMVEKIIIYISENDEFSSIKAMDKYNLKKGIERYRFYSSEVTFKINLLDMLIGNNIKFTKMYTRKEILRLREFI